MITEANKLIIFEIDKIPLLWCAKDRKDFLYFFHLATVSTGHTFTEQERIRLRQLRRKYIPDFKLPQNKKSETCNSY